MVSSVTPIYRIVHIANLPVCLQRGGLHAPNYAPEDGYAYRTIHNTQIQAKRHRRAIPCGPGGTIHDYVGFYFGVHSPMLFQLHTTAVPTLVVWIFVTHSQSISYVDICLFAT